MAYKKVPIYVTLQEVLDMVPCKRGWKTLLRGIDYDKTYAYENVCVPLSLILEVNGPFDTKFVIDEMILDREYWGEFFDGGMITRLRRLSDHVDDLEANWAWEIARFEDDPYGEGVESLDFTDHDSLELLKYNMPGIYEDVVCNVTRAIQNGINGLQRYEKE